MKNRIELVRKELVKRKINAMLVTRLSSVRWLCGFSGTAGTLLITSSRAFFLTDFRYESQASQQVKNADVIVYKRSLYNELETNKTLKAPAKLLVEASVFTLEQCEALKKVWKKTELIPVTNLIEPLSAIKDESEIKLHKKAAAITDEVFGKVLQLIKPGVRELDIGAEITYWHRKLGADGDSFEPIVASGKRGALPHGRASAKLIANGELVTLDMGCYYQGYASDLTRTVAVGKANKKQKELYEIVLHAQRFAIKAAKPGMKTRELDSVARDIITKAGYGDRFGHGLGHGLGIEVHSFPRVSQQDTNTLAANMIFTIEPGIYLEGFGGVRIEDDVLLTDQGAKSLNKSPKELIIL